MKITNLNNSKLETLRKVYDIISYNGQVKFNLPFYVGEDFLFIDNFSEEDGRRNLAATQRYPSDGTFGGPLACGKDGYNMSKGKPLLDGQGNPIKAFICAYRKPATYYVLLNNKGRVVKSVFEEDRHELHANTSKGETVEERHYEGCPHWNRPDPFAL